MWMTSLGLDFTINNLVDDCRPGIPLLRIEDHLQPGCVDWKKVNMKPRNIHEVSSPRREPWSAHPPSTEQRSRPRRDSASRTVTTRATWPRGSR